MLGKSSNSLLGEHVGRKRQDHDSNIIREVESAHRTSILVLESHGRDRHELDDAHITPLSWRDSSAREALEIPRDFWAELTELDALSP